MLGRMFGFCFIYAHHFVDRPERRRLPGGGDGDANRQEQKCEVGADGSLSGEPGRGRCGREKRVLRRNAGAYARRRLGIRQL